MTHIRIISYLPNPRVYKATIAARYSGAEIEVLGDTPPKMADWLWDYDAFEMTEADKEANLASLRKASVGFAGDIYKTHAFLVANPFGDIPMAYANRGKDGVFESNSIMRLAALSGPNAPVLYGATPEEQARVDGFLDKTLLLADLIQKYILAGNGLTVDLHKEMQGAFNKYCSVLDNILSDNCYLVGSQLSLADIAMVCELALMSNEGRMIADISKINCKPILSELKNYNALYKHIQELMNQDEFSEDLASYSEFMGLENTASNK
ncbi:glutathione binding-like protein [Alphaproteobacteria bacterium]|nr:glutathione binding-like protein [Alphaproteobacteria bacterium]